MSIPLIRTPASLIQFVPTFNHPDLSTNANKYLLKQVIVKYSAARVVTDKQTNRQTCTKTNTRTLIRALMILMPVSSKPKLSKSFVNISAYKIVYTSECKLLNCFINVILYDVTPYKEVRSFFLFILKLYNVVYVIFNR